MADEQVTEVEPVEVTGNEGRHSRVTQAQWDAQRKASKKRAAVTIKANAKKAEAAKRKAQAKDTPFDDGDLKAKAKAVEERTNKRARDRLKAEESAGTRQGSEVQK
jgi:hypothetical protein